MSSMRNAVSRRNHKERSQPESRTRWGLLEKHKDYSLRAQDYNRKKQKLDVLTQKSRERHPDEFAFGMLSADKGVQGKHGRGDQNQNRLSIDTVKLLKTQDSGYLRTAAARGRREIQRLQEEVQLGNVIKTRSPNADSKILFDEHGQPVKKRRRVSVDNLDQVETDATLNMDLDQEQATETDGMIEKSEPEDTTSRSKSKKQLGKETIAATKQKAEKRRRRLLRERRAARLVDLKKRQQEILAAAGQLDLQRARMARMVGGTNKDGVKFKIRERKK